MLSQTLLIALSGAVAVSALPNNVQERQVEDYAECASAISSAYKGMPTPPPELQSFYMTQTQTDFCSMTYPASLQPVVSSFQSAGSSWAAANSAKVSSAMSKCPDMASLTNDIQLPSCTGGTDSSNSGGSSDGNDDTSGGSDNDNDNNNNNSNSDSDENAGHRNTGVAGLAVAAAAFIGVVAVVL
ncbi:predicted protein [Chaetomium globosum CBS 148.51]|uniref:Infection structure specific protein n=1 Tax=Chaetomium globosum (strain ATCC 6205 / CBS 148.51 / DSM 1962 / NBRC 6347 / NRRL 1970) TaxID=306901 RepID=Q2H1E2_CHAGB|nr:uncharacterized protein CHGG_04404 [Chaetomium globosum CBS 148.51]EAQ87785.1 predicted protein [Chaetomium globosum CBS 148.51]